MTEQLRKQRRCELIEKLSKAEWGKLPTQTLDAINMLVEQRIKDLKKEEKHDRPDK